METKKGKSMATPTIDIGISAAEREKIAGGLSALLADSYTLYLMTHKPDLGIKSPYELTEAQYKASLELLRAQRKLVGRYWHDAFIQIDDFKNEGVVASGSWPFQVTCSRARINRSHRWSRTRVSPGGPTRP